MIDEKVNRRRTLGLALGGGGARALAHIGVLKVLEREGVAVDCLAGTSMGGLLAALWAAGWPAEEIEREVLRMSRRSNLVRLIDLAAPRRGLLEGSRVRHYLEGLFGGRAFADLRLPLALVAVDLVTGREATLCQGPLVEAVLATTAVPGLFPPVAHGRQLLADGGLLDNVPTSAARTLGAQITLAVDVTLDLAGECMPDEENRSQPWPGQNWPALLPPFARDFYQAELIMISAITRARLAQFPPDLLLRPAVPPCVSIFWGLGHASEAIAAGEEAAIQVLPELRKAIDSVRGGGEALPTPAL